MAIEFNMVITNEGIDFAREASANANWHLVPKRYAVSATAGELSVERDYTSMLATWTTNTLTSQLNGTNKIQDNVVIRANASNVDRQIGEIYFIYTNESHEEFLFAIAQPSSRLMFTPGIQQNYIFVWTLNNTNVQDIVEINYSFSDDIDSHNTDPHAHPYLLARDGSRTATGILQYAVSQTFGNPLDIVDKEYVDSIKNYVDTEVPKAVPIGTVLPWMSPNTTYPSGYLYCNGAAVSRTTYSELFNALGTIYGAGDGSTTFNIPDLRGMFLRGNNGDAAAMGTQQLDGAPNISGSIGALCRGGDTGWTNTATGCFTKGNGPGWGPEQNGSAQYSIGYFNASRSSSKYSNITEVRPVNYAAQYIIRAANTGQESGGDEPAPTPEYVFTIIPTPSNATVVLNDEMRNSVTVEAGTNVSYTVSAEGYNTQQGNITVNTNQNLSIVLTEITYTVTINPTPSNATVRINGAETRSITARAGTSFNWEVSADGYQTRTGQTLVSQTETINITLTALTRYMCYQGRFRSSSGSFTCYVYHPEGATGTYADGLMYFNGNPNGTPKVAYRNDYATSASQLTTRPQTLYDTRTDAGISISLMTTAEWFTSVSGGVPNRGEIIVATSSNINRYPSGTYTATSFTYQEGHDIYG